MKKFLKKTKWVLIISCFFILSICLVFIFLLPCEDQRLLANNIIQASAIVTLVIVTLSYVYYTMKLADQAKKQSIQIAGQAKQTKELAERTKELVEEQIGKRTADFWERRIDEFYKPFADQLGKMMKYISESRDDADKTWKIILDTRDIFLRRSYMVSCETLKKLIKIEPLFFQAQNIHPKRKEVQKKFIESRYKIKDIVVKEWNDIEHYLRSFYGIENEGES